MTNNFSTAPPAPPGRRMPCVGPIPHVPFLRRGDRLCDNAMATTVDTSARDTRTAAGPILGKALRRSRKHQFRKIPTDARVGRTPTHAPRSGEGRVPGTGVLLTTKTHAAPRTRTRTHVRVVRAARNRKKT